MTILDTTKEEFEEFQAWRKNRGEKNAGQSVKISDERNNNNVSPEQNNNRGTDVEQRTINKGENRTNSNEFVKLEIEPHPKTEKSANKKQQWRCRNCEHVFEADENDEIPNECPNPECGCKWE